MVTEVETLRRPKFLNTDVARSGKTIPDRVVAILPRGEAVRNFVYTGALDEIAKEAELTLLTVLPNGEIQDLLETRYQNVVELEPIRERWVVGMARELLDMAHGRWLWSEAARQRWLLRDIEAETIPARVKRILKKTACYPFANRLGLQLLSKAECTLSHLLRPSNTYVELFKRLNPSLVFNSSHVHCPAAVLAVHAARSLGIPTATFIFSWDNLTSQGRIIPPYDYYLVWNDAIREQLLSIYGDINPKRVFVTGTPQFDFHFRPELYWTREEFCEKVGADASRPIVLYSTGMANHVSGEPLIVEQMANLLQEMIDLGPPQLVVRVYPKDHTGRFDSLKKNRPDILFPEVPWERAWLTPKPEDCYLLTNMLLHADVGINIASTISLELCMFDKPVINIGYRPSGEVLGRKDFDYCRYYDFEHYQPVVKSGAIEMATSEENLREKIAEALSDPGRSRLQRQELIQQFFGNTLDGWSSMRVASVIELLASRNRRSGAAPQWGVSESLNYVQADQEKS